MAAVYLANVATVILNYDIGAGHPVVNVTHWQGQNNPWTFAQLRAIQSAVDVSWSSSYAPRAAPSTHYTGCIVIDSSAPTGLEVVNDTFVPQAGVAVAGPVADNAAVLISFHQLQRYKGGHGRIYIPGISLDELMGDGRTLSAATITNFNTAWNSLTLAMAGVNAANGGPFTQVVWHKKQKGFLNTVQAVTSFNTSSILASQRRRLRKVSRHRKNPATGP